MTPTASRSAAALFGDRRVPMSQAQRVQPDWDHPSGIGVKLPASETQDSLAKEVESGLAMASLMAARPAPGSPQDMIRFLFALTLGIPDRSHVLDGIVNATIALRRSQTNEWLRGW